MKRFRTLTMALGVLCALAVTTLCAPALAAGQEGHAVSAELWNGWYIYVDGAPAVMADESGTYQWPLAWQGSVYIPLQTAGEWLGCDPVWDREAGTVILTSGGTPDYRDAAEDQDYQAWRVQVNDQYRQARTEGIDIEPRFDLSVLLDGEAQTFADVNGRATGPVLYGGSLYLPVRGVARICGKEILYLPAQEATPGVTGTSVTQLALLLEPDLSYGVPPHIYLYDTPTEEQMKEAQHWLDEARALLCDGPVDAVEVLLTDEKLDTEDAVKALERIVKGLDALSVLPQPEFPLLTGQWEAVVSHCGERQRQFHEEFRDALEEGGLEPGGLRADGTFSQLAVEYLGFLRFDLDRGQELLDAVVSQQS